mmetsp:Transcript_88155/g.184200  ORF Transcript_88155/g.184200 Transcript_88155/m.184200 type:complete len:87 (+) Transcript_88155:37-297(+)
MRAFSFVRVFVMVLAYSALPCVAQETNQDSASGRNEGGGVNCPFLARGSSRRDTCIFTPSTHKKESPDDYAGIYSGVSPDYNDDDM